MTTEPPIDQALVQPFDQPRSIASEILTLARPLLIVFDCDGVLAPITDHADNSALLAGVGALLVDLAEFDDVDVAVLSGRSLAGLQQFDFDDRITVAGSYGGERRGRPASPLSSTERERLTTINEILHDATELAGAGAWVETKPTSAVLHIREADAERGVAAIDYVNRRRASLPGHECHVGDQVIELMTRAADKGDGLRKLRGDFSPASLVYLGDDVPDEDAFAQLDEHDIGIKIGRGPSLATRRLADPDAVVHLLRELTRDAQI